MISYKQFSGKRFSRVQFSCRGNFTGVGVIFLEGGGAIFHGAIILGPNFMQGNFTGRTIFQEEIILGAITLGAISRGE